MGLSRNVREYPEMRTYADIDLRFLSYSFPSFSVVILRKFCLVCEIIIVSEFKMRNCAVKNNENVLKSVVGL